MLTYDLKQKKEHPAQPLYMALYRAIRQDICEGRLAPGDRLPSKRALAAHLQISKVTVENAYAQLEAEGYICARPRSGFYVEQLPEALTPEPEEKETVRIDSGGQDRVVRLDLCKNSMPAVLFPFTLWAKLTREVLTESGEMLMEQGDPAGAYPLRCAIADYLYRMRGMAVSAEQIIIGAGTENLYQQLILLLGHSRHYATEDPGYPKIRRLFEAGEVRYSLIPMDGQGVLPQELADSGAEILHLSPNHHFPTGVVTPVSRRRQLLNWAHEKPERYIIEDDYDSEFRFTGAPIPPMFSDSHNQSVIYLNTFSKTISPALRIAYMVLPPALLQRYRQRLGFSGGTVSLTEQLTLTKYLENGQFERHLMRMKKYYRQLRDLLLQTLRQMPFSRRIQILEQDAGLHFILRVEWEGDDLSLKAFFDERGIRVRLLDEYYAADASPCHTHCLLINYSGITAEQIRQIPALFAGL